MSLQLVRRSSTENRKSFIFVFGPSGVGKSEFCRALIEEFGVLHLQPDAGSLFGKGIHSWQQWTDSLFSQSTVLLESVDAMCEALCEDLRFFPQDLVAIEFGSTHCPRAQLLELLAYRGVMSVVLYASKRDCREAFLLREESLRRGLGTKHWELFNQNHRYFLQPDLAPWRIETVSAGMRKSLEQQVREFKKRLRNFRLMKR